VLGQADPEVRRHAVEAVDGLPSLGLCEDVPALRVRAPLPEDPAVRAEVDALEDARVRMQAQGRSGRYADALGRASEVLEAARAVGYAPLLARTLRDRAELHERLGRSEDAAADLRQAWVLALETADDALAAEASVRLVSVLGYSLKRFSEAEVRVEEAEAMIERVRRHDARQAEALAADLDLARGQIELRQHRYAAASERFERALAVIERQAGPDGLRVAEALGGLASARLPTKQWDQAHGLFERVLAIRTKHLGPAHPSTAQTRNNLALALKNMGRIDEAIAQLELARALTIAALGSEHPAVRMAEMNLAESYHLAARHCEAVDAYALSFADRSLGEIDDEYMLRRVVHYGLSLAACGRLGQARELLELAHARARALGDPRTVRIVELELAHVDVESGRPARALARLDRLASPASEPDIVARDVLLTRARTLAGLGRHDDARALLPAIRAAAGKDLHPADLERLLATLEDRRPR